MNFSCLANLHGFTVWKKTAVRNVTDDNIYIVYMVTPGGATDKKMSSLSLPSLPFAFTITRDHLLFVADPVTRKMQG